MSTATLTSVPIAELHPHEHNVRMDLDGLDGLAASVKAAGIIQPLVVTPREAGGYTIIAGHRRHAAAQMAGLDLVPCVVTDTEAAAQSVAMLHENTNRDGLTDAERAYGIQQALDLGADPKSLATGLQLKPAEVKRFVKARDFGEQTRAFMHTAQLTLEDAERLASFEAHPDEYATLLVALDKPNTNTSWAFEEAARSVAYREAVAKTEAYAGANNVTITDKHTWESNVHILRTDKDIEAHAGATCHAVKPEADSEAGFLHLCVNAKLHRTDSGSGEELPSEEVAAALSAERKRVVANNKAFASAEVVRREWVEGLQTRKSLPKGTLVPVVQLMAYHAPEHEDLRLSMRVMNIEVGTGWPSFAQIAEAVTNEAQATRALLLAVVQSNEKRMDKSVWRNANRGVAPYLELLATLGYVLTPPEAALVERINADLNTSDFDYPGGDSN